MRQIYSSPRVENIERVVALMAEHGIATRVTNRRVYEGTSYSRFSYAHPGSSANWPVVWVTHASDHTRARQLMREIGIEPPTRYAEDLAEYRRRSKRRPDWTAARVRTVVLVALVVAIAVYAARMASVW